MPETDTTLSLATKLATSYVGNNKVTLAEIPTLISGLHEALARLESGEPVREPAVPINKSVKRNEIICLECGKGHKMLKRHLTSAHELTVEEYRARCAHSEAKRAPIPMQRGQSFRLIAGSESDATRAVGEGGLTTTAG